MVRRSTPRRALIGDAGGKKGSAALTKKKAVKVAPAPAPAEALDEAEAEAEAPAEAEAEAAEGDGVAKEATPPAAAQVALPARGAYRFTAADVDGTPHPLAEYAGKARTTHHCTPSASTTAVTHAAVPLAYDR